MRQFPSSFRIALATAGTIATAASGQCPDWRTEPLFNDGAVIQAVTSWDPDGSGPQSPWLVVAGDLNRAAGMPVSNIAAWDGSTWRALGAGILNTHGFGVQALAVYNGQLIAGGGFAFAGQEVCFNIARWDGDSWRPLGDGIFGDVPNADTEVCALTVYNNELIAAGRFAQAGENQTRNIARWNGFQWNPLDSGIRGSFEPLVQVNALGVYNGELYAGGYFDVAGGVTCRNIARWNGSTWQGVAGGIGDDSFEDRVRALTVHQNELIVGGTFTNIGGNTGICRHLARWNGTAWGAVGTGTCGLAPNDSVFSLASMDGSLYVAGSIREVAGTPVDNIARWDGSSWRALAQGVNSWAKAMTLHDNSLVVAGYFSRAGADPADALARWNGSAWLPTVGVQVDPPGRIDAMTPWAGKVVMGGSHRTITPTGYVSLLTTWDGVNTSGLGHPDGTVRAMTTTPGVALSTDLIIAGDFTSIDGEPFNRIARRDDTITGGWQAMGDGFNNSVMAVEVHNGSIYAGGHFRTSGSTTLNYIARWNGTSWTPLDIGMSGPVYALKSYNGRLYVGGEFQMAGGTFAPGLAVWTGTNWTSLHPGFAGKVHALTIYENSLIIGGEFPGVPGGANINAYNGVFLDGLAGGINGPVRALTVSNGTLVAGGEFTSAGGVSVSNLARWTGPAFPSGSGSWSSLGGGTDAAVYSLASYADELHVGGEFIDIRNNSQYSPVWARFSETGVVWIAEQPTSTNAACGSSANFRVVAAIGYPELVYQWRKDGSPLTNGPTKSGSTINLDGARLEIENIGQSDAGAYDCVVSNGCGSTTSVAAALTIVGSCNPCIADFNDDGIINSQDFFDFLDAFFDAAAEADINDDGATNSQDFFDFLGVFFSGC